MKKNDNIMEAFFVKDYKSVNVGTYNRTHTTVNRDLKKVIFIKNKAGFLKKYGLDLLSINEMKTWLLWFLLPAICIVATFGISLIAPIIYTFKYSDVEKFRKLNALGYVPSDKESELILKELDL